MRIPFELEKFQELRAAGNEPAVFSCEIKQLVIVLGPEAELPRNIAVLCYTKGANSAHGFSADGRFLGTDALPAHNLVMEVPDPKWEPTAAECAAFVQEANRYAVGRVLAEQPVSLDVACAALKRIHELEQQIAEARGAR